MVNQPNAASMMICTDNSLTSNKRSRVAMDHYFRNVPINNQACDTNFNVPQKINTADPQLSLFTDEDILPLIQQNSLEIDAIISHHTKRIRLELEKRQKQHEQVLVAAVRENVLHNLKKRDEQIERMRKFNLVLQQRVKIMFNENKILRELAERHAATANSLRNNLQLVSAKSTAEDYAESCCSGSEPQINNIKSNAGNGYSDTKCRSCGERESCVVVLPCRHLCLCNVCGSASASLYACPVCHSSMNATLHVNMSS